MRIVCQRCAAAYAIDDRLIGTKGVRAQCPRCRNLQLVTRTEPPPSAEVPEPAAPLAASGAARAQGLAEITPVGPPGQVRCLTCAKVLTDPFDQALGVCEECRLRETTAPPAAPAPLAALVPLAPGPEEPAPKPKPITGRNATAGPEPAPGSMPITGRNPAAGPKPTSGRFPTAPPLMSGASAARANAPPRRGLVVGISAGAAAAALAVVLFIKPGVLRPKPKPPSAVPTAIARAIPAWKLSFPEVSGSAAEHLTEGEAKLAADLPAAYSEAAEAFKKAFLLDPVGDAALAGYVLAVSLGRDSLDDATYTEAQGLIEAAELRSGRAARALVAHAHLLLARPAVPGNVERARALADEAGRTAQGEQIKAEALLVAGRSYVGTSSEMATQQLDQALALAPNLKRAYLYRALARAAGGQYQAAIGDFQKRLSLDAEQWEALAGLSTLYAEVGDAPLAHKVWEVVARDHPNDIRAKLPLAVLAYQLDGKAADAVIALKALVRARKRLEDAQVEEVLVHLAAAQRAAGDGDGAVEAATEALAIQAEDPAAHLQLFLVALDRGIGIEAAKHLPFIVGHLGDPALEALFTGQLRMAQGDFVQAADAFEASAVADPRRLDARLLAGVAAARAASKERAFKDLFAAAQLDPTRTEPRPVISRFFVQPRELLRAAEGHLIRLATENDEQVAKVDEALILFHRHQLERADKLLVEALTLDDNNALAHALRALIALERGDKALARSESTAAVGAERELALAHYAAGVALLAANDLEGAQRELREALARAPSFGAATVALAQIEVKRRDEASARDRLTRLVSVDPSYVAAKRALYALDRRGVAP